MDVGGFELEIVMKVLGERSEVRLRGGCENRCVWDLMYVEKCMAAHGSVTIWLAKGILWPSSERPADETGSFGRKKERTGGIRKPPFNVLGPEPHRICCGHI